MCLNFTADFTKVLPSEISWRVFTQLPLRGQIIASLVCKRWNELTSSDEFWSLFLERHQVAAKKNGKTLKEQAIEFLTKNTVAHCVGLGVFSSVHVYDRE